MEGWKTWTGVAGLVIGAVLNAMSMDDAAKIVYGFAIPIVIVGIGHKLDKVIPIVRMASKGLSAVADQLEQVKQAPPAPPAV